MAKEMKDGSGTLSLSQYYEEGGNKPKHYGRIKLTPELIDKIVAKGYILPLSGWEKDGDYGPFISLAVDTWALDKEDKPDGFQQAQEVVDAQQPLPDTDVPF
jgi:hypothetical protein